MRIDLPMHYRELHVYNNHTRILKSTLAPSTEGDGFLHIWQALWALQGRAPILIYIISANSTGNSHCKVKDSVGTVVN